MVVMGKAKGLIRNCLIIALYERFLSCPPSELMNPLFDPDEIAARAAEIEKMFPDSPDK